MAALSCRVGKSICTAIFAADGKRYSVQFINAHDGQHRGGFVGLFTEDEAAARVAEMRRHWRNLAAQRRRRKRTS
jgi:hypothetical protein